MVYLNKIKNKCEMVQMPIFTLHCRKRLWFVLFMVSAVYLYTCKLNSHILNKILLRS